MTYVKIAKKILVPVAALMFATGLSRADAVDQRKRNKYQHLPKLLRLAERPTTFVALTEFEDDDEKSAHTAGIEYLNNHPQLVERIREDLGSKEIHWQMEGLSHRLLYVPEGREEVAGLFTQYCQEAIDDLLDRTGLVNPYDSISTLTDEGTGSTQSSGIRAVIVQDLARENVARYQFSGTSEKRINIGLSERITINEVGSYSSFLHYSKETDTWRFSRDSQTVWKSVSANPYTVLMTPLEETLHIALREYTEKAIIRTFNDRKGNLSPAEVQQAVEEWLAVEEAVVGGLVYSLVPDVLIKRIPDLPQEWIQSDLAVKDRFPKYRHLRKAIKLVQGLGLKKSIDMYARNPVAFRRLLTTHT